MNYGVSMRIPGGKGSIQRPANHKAFDENYDKIFGKRPKQFKNEILEKQRETEALEEWYGEEPSMQRD